MKKVISVSLDRDLFDIAKNYAEENGIKLSALFNALLRNYLKDHGVDVE